MYDFIMFYVFWSLVIAFNATRMCKWGPMAVCNVHIYCYTHFRKFVLCAVCWLHLQCYATTPPTTTTIIFGGTIFVLDVLKCQDLTHSIIRILWKANREKTCTWLRLYILILLTHLHAHAFCHCRINWANFLSIWMLLLEAY